jgi:hypothetical protein
MACPRSLTPAVEPVVTEVLPAHPLDRRRIDSDVREMLRQPSTPWITYDRRSRASSIAVGDLLPRRASVIDGAGLDAAPSGAARMPAAAAVEPSGLAVASDVGSVVTTVPVVADAADAADVRARRRGGWSTLNVAVVAAGLTLSAGLVVATSVYENPSVAAARTAAAGKMAAPKATPVPEVPRDDLTPPDLGAALGSASLGHGAAPAAASAGDGATPGKDGKFGRLVIRGAARTKPVYLDGKRLLGAGARTFTVPCGAHRISTSGRNDGKEIEVPCTGELVLDR